MEREYIVKWTELTHVYDTYEVRISSEAEDFLEIVHEAQDYISDFMDPFRFRTGEDNTVIGITQWSVTPDASSILQTISEEEGEGSSSDP